MRTMTRAAGLAMAIGMLAVPSGVGAQDRDPPYFASISASRAYMRTGPGRNFPASWLYQRSGLPVRVIEIYENWRKVEDPDGTQGWMLVNLLSSERTAIVRGEIATMHDQPQAGSRIAYRVEPGVSGRISQCGNGWCRFDVRGRAGFIAVSSLWGVASDERIR